jgi:hypothetical protein
MNFWNIKKLILVISTLFVWSLTVYSDELPPRYHRYDEAINLLASLRDAHPEIIRLDTVGYSERLQIPILRVKISIKPAVDQDRPAAFIDGGVHASEVLGPEIVLGFIQDIVKRYARGERKAIKLINSLEIYCIPFINPEGHLVVESGNTRWRKNQCDNDHNGIFDNHDGVDNNRNYEVGWGVANDANATTPESAQYRGTAPFTQHENISMRDFGWHYRPIVALDYHSPSYGMGEVVYHPWYWRLSDGGHGVAPDEAMMASIARNFAALIINDRDDSTYRVRRSLIEDGDFNSYFYGNFGTVVFTVEVSDTTIQNPRLVDDIVDRNLPSIYYLLERALKGGITGVIRDSVTLEPLEAEVRVMERTNADIKPRMSRPDLGRYDRILDPGVYTLGFLKNGYYPQQINRILIGNAPVVQDIYLSPYNPRPPAPIPQSRKKYSKNKQITFDWSPVKLAKQYLFEVSIDSTFSNIVVRDSSIAETKFAPRFQLSSGQYYWRVKGSNENGWGPYSVVSSIKIGAKSSPKKRR